MAYGTTPPPTPQPVAPPTPVGLITPWAGASTPADTNWLLCDGSAISRTTYAALFALIGTTFGAGNGSSTFNVPDLRGRVPLGVGTATGAAGATAHTRGQKGGEETHVTTSAENGPHTHDGIQYALTPVRNDAAQINVTVSVGGGGGSAFNTTSSGSGTPHNTLPPYLGLNFVIRAL